MRFAAVVGGISRVEIAPEVPSRVCAAWSVTLGADFLVTVINLSKPSFKECMVAQNAFSEHVLGSVEVDQTYEINMQRAVEAGGLAFYIPGEVVPCFHTLVCRNGVLRECEMRFVVDRDSGLLVVAGRPVY
jgi:hypothetical protein